MVTLDSAVAVPDDVLHREVDGEVVLLSLGSGAYFGLDPVGARMWALLAERRSLRLAFEALLEEFEVDADQLGGDLLALVTALEEQGLVKVESGSR